MALAADAITGYEELLNERLKVELERVHDQRDRLHEQIAHTLELRNNVQLVLDQKQTSLKTMVNLGSDFYVQAHVPDTSYIYVSVGLGFHAQLTLDEALTFCTQREAQLNEAVETLTDRGARLKARIKLVLAAIDELSMASQQLPGRSGGGGSRRGPS